MDRRDFLKKTSAAAAATAGGTAFAGAAGAQALSAQPLGQPPGPAPLAAPAVIGGARSLTAIVPDHTALHGSSDSARRLFREIETATDGRYRFEMTSTHQSSPGLSGIIDGKADAAFSSPHEDMAHHKAFAYFAGLPAGLGMDAAGLQSWMVMGGGELLDELTADFGVKSLLAGHLGATPALWATSEITTLDDLKSRRLSVPGLGHEVLAAIGASFPVAYRWSSETAARQLVSGQTDAADVGGAFTALQSGIMDKAHFAYESALNPHGSTLALHVSASVWDGMSNADRLIVSSLASAAYHSALSENLAHEALARRIASSAHGVTFKPLPTEISGAMTGVAGAIFAHTATIDRLSERINARYMAFKRVVDDTARPAAFTVPTA